MEENKFRQKKPKSRRDIFQHNFITNLQAFLLCYDSNIEKELLITLNNESFYEGYKYSKRQIECHQSCTKGRIIENIESYVQSIIKENRNIGAMEIIEKVRGDLATLPRKERKYIMELIYRIAENFNTVRKFLDFKNGPYKTPKELLCAMRGITSSELIKKITDDINVIQYGTGFTFFVGDEQSYLIIKDLRIEDSDQKKLSLGFNTWRSAIEGLNGTLSVVNGPYTNNKHGYESKTIIHEGQHNRNYYFMPDVNGEPITRAKDEIIANLRELSSIYKADNLGEGIKNILTETLTEGGLYQYGLKGEARENHKRTVEELIKYADDLIQLTECPIIGLKKEIVINILSYTPYKKRKELHKNIIEAISIFLLNEFGTTGETLEEKKNMLNTIYQNSKYTPGDISQGNEKNKNYTNNFQGTYSKLLNSGAYKTLIDESILAGFRRTGIASKETEMETIKKAKSIDEIKHILKDPKFSHISRGPNNKGGIEISAMIDEIMSGYLPITFLPPEIREIVENFIEK